MKNKEYLKKYLFQILVVIFIFLLLFIFIGNIEYNKYKQNFNYKLNAILETVQTEYPNVEKEKLLEILTSNEVSENILREYGYDIESDSYISLNDKTNLIFSIINIVTLLTSFLILIYL